MDHLEEYYAFIAPTVSQKTIDIYRCFMAQFTEYCRRARVTNPTVKDVEDWTNKALASGQTINGHCQARFQVDRYYRWAVKRGYVERNPVDWDMIQKLTPIPATRQFFTYEQYMKLLDACRINPRPYWYGAVLVGWNTGLRVSDVAMLQWASIDAATETMKIKLWKVRRLNIEVEIPIDADLFDYLTELKANRRYLNNPYVFPEMYGYYQFKGLPRQFEIVCKHAGLPDHSFHCLRHSFISRMINCGVDSQIVCSITGLSIQMVATYAHISLDAKRNAMHKARLAMQAD